jgi:hypothetical protein
MGRTTPIMTSFNGGEISPRLMGRVDQAIYQISAAEMLNFVPTIEGPAMKRSGFRHIRPAAAGASFLSPFIFSDAQAYILEWGAGAIRFFTNNGRIETDPVTPYELVVPYTALEAPLLSQQQSYDRLYLAHTSQPPASILRTSATTFTYAELDFVNGPFGNRNADETAKVIVGARDGVGISVTAIDGAGPFHAEDVGGFIMIEAMGFGNVKAWEPQARADGGQLAVGDLRRSDGKVYECVAIAGVRTGTIQPTHTRGEEWDGSGQSILGYDTQTAGVQWKFLYDGFGVGKITGFTNVSIITVDVVRPFADSLIAAYPSYRWSLPAWNSASGYPAQVLLAFERLIFFTGFELIASTIGDYGGGSVNMAPFSDGGLITPDAAFRLRLAISNPVLWAKQDRDIILIGTADGVYAIRKINASQIFSSDNVECVKQTHFGVSRCRPVQAGTATIIVQSGGRKLREAGYDLNSDRYLSPTLNLWQRHITRGGVNQLAFQGEPEELLWIVRGDGQLALHPHVPEQEVKGFSRISHGGGPILSATTIPGGDGRDQLWALVNGAIGKTIEILDPPWEEGETAIADAFYVDSGTTYDGAPTTTIMGLDHLNGQSVAILADGAVVTGLIVNAGAITLDQAASKVQVGIGYTGRLTFLQPEVRDASGSTIQGKRKRLVRMMLRLLESAGVKLDPGNGKPEDVVDRPRSTPYDQAPPIFTGDTDKPIGGSWTRTVAATVISSDPLPCMVVGAMPQLELDDK